MWTNQPPPAQPSASPEITFAAARWGQPTRTHEKIPNNTKTLHIFVHQIRYTQWVLKREDGKKSRGISFAAHPVRPNRVYIQHIIYYTSSTILLLLMLRLCVQQRIRDVISSWSRTFSVVVGYSTSPPFFHSSGHSLPLQCVKIQRTGCTLCRLPR